MANWKKQIQKTFKVEETDLKAHIYYTEPRDPGDEPQLRFTLHVSTGTDYESGDVSVEDALTPAQKKSFMVALQRLRDAALVAGGFAREEEDGETAEDVEADGED